MEALTGLRGVAALFVFLFHYLHFNPDIRLQDIVPVLGRVAQFPFDFGFMGVDLFFVLSGFLLSLPFAARALGKRGAIDVKRYFLRRVLRVYPAYYAQLALILLIGSWFVTWKPLQGTSLVAHLFMFFNIGPEPVRSMVGVWWTLPVEFSFYLLLPLLAWMMRPKWWPAVIPLLIASIYYRFWTTGHFEPINPLMLAAHHLPGALPEFLMGAAAAVVTQWLNHDRCPSWRLLDFLAVMSMALVGVWFMLIVGPNGDAYWNGHWSMVASPTVLGFVLAVLVWSVYNGSRLGRMLFSNRLVHFLGLISYSLYLWHFVVMQQLLHVWGDGYGAMSPLPKFLLTTAAVILVSWLSYWFVERPFFRQHRFSKKAT